MGRTRMAMRVNLSSPILRVLRETLEKIRLRTADGELRMGFPASQNFVNFFVDASLLRCIRCEFRSIAQGRTDHFFTNRENHS
jgi:hypothetical protein